MELTDATIKKIEKHANDLSTMVAPHQLRGETWCK